jgi:hypothetical protein
VITKSYVALPVRGTKMVKKISERKQRKTLRQQEQNMKTMQEYYRVQGIFRMTKLAQAVREALRAW